MVKDHTAEVAAELGTDIPLPIRRRRDPSAEWRLQIRCIKYLREICRWNKNIRFIAPQPESPRNMQRAAIAKLMGLERGVLDVWIFERAPFRLTVIELKRPGGKLTPEQAEWMSWLDGCGRDVRTFKCETFEEFTRVCPH